MCGDYYDDDCDHMDYDLDILTGIAECDLCGHRWFMSSDQLKTHERLQRDFDREMARLEKKAPPTDSTAAVALLSDDEIPF